MNLEQFGWCANSTSALAFASFEQAAWVAARVIAEQRGAYRVHTGTVAYPAQITGQLQHRTVDPLMLPAVGDWVVVEPHATQNTATIHQVLPRTSQFVRKVAGTTTAGQVVAANVDTVFLMSGLDGDFNLRRIERYLVTAWDSGASPVIVLNKVDVCTDVAATIAQVAAIAIGVPIHAVSAELGRGLSQLDPYLQPGKTVALIGSSGVGKSTLTNYLLGDAQQSTQAVRADDSRGRHTTTHRQLIRLPSGALLIDTPGMRELQLWQVGAGLSETFADIEALAADCKFRDCQHDQEPGCAVQAAIAAGQLTAQRLQSYQKLQREQQWIEQRREGHAHQNTKRRWKQITKTMRQRQQPLS
ncbi:ribosome small subunit-dependent GTPase A [Leptolyngbya iicbica]|uniref:Small ribosomal subunit biogenesis GTPase RsgA n=2 Tax=Cyanophyceae TaxID=3028117 RepID=A0A4Q7E1F6_9CYAN|nr:ribosome small subunit-dependent GTPase A [Leptolyngbya sp. LK]RZM75234.1 ribosome small subunit-dependent GTPase A [Leptolyngbya sp. LK]